ncbi:phage tail protein [Pseudanabaena galeata UHCC 0370]|jgi:phage tail-like protein|uniref:Phage tail protein n=1 Tax=Pseudanabaena galeata UHCC 0370 TaxID=3110310 RepID=A0ABU5TFC5_9CYAN|nr:MULTISPECIES: phage tail protein [Pseudanabaena]MEA5476398.1 phage tail protein [Pseudanabaena galeata UHCC 0370]MEA5487735.1 phage tail protein [Pseudanabaena sp. CCNP1317]WGS72526.1 phage tail protein [Pseudanabaena galeata CCNP1313]
MTNSSRFARAESYVTTNHFYVEMLPTATIVAGFTECSGLSASVDTDKFFEGGVNDQKRILLKQTSFTEVTLKHGVTNDLSFWRWFTATTNRRRNIRILLFNQAGETRQCWTLIGAVPVGWTAPSLQADGNSVAIEELKLAIEGLTVSFEGGGAATVVTRNSASGSFPSS